MNPTILMKTVPGMNAHSIYESNDLTLLEARVLFRLARKRLLDTSNWHKWYKDPRMKFILLDNSGSHNSELETEDRPIFARLEAIEFSNDKLADAEHIAVKVTPVAASPAKFIVQRKGTRIVAFMLAISDLTGPHWQNLTSGLLDNLAIS